MLNAFWPCLPTSVTKAPTGEHWVHEIKHDGFRIIARRIGPQPGPSKSWLKVKNKEHVAMQRVREAFERERTDRRKF
jgi:ATP-dependent DNA ligase